MIYFDEYKALIETSSCFPKTTFDEEKHELVLEPDLNVRFPTKGYIDCNILECCSGYARKGNKYFKEGLNCWFNHEFSQHELDLIDSCLGGGINRDLCLKYFKHKLKISVLEKRSKKNKNEKSSITNRLK